MSNNRYKPILPAPSLRPATGPRPSSSTPLPKKRAAVRIACNTCRSKRTACDGERPSCAACLRRGSECVYLSASAADTPTMVMKREMEQLRAKYKDLSDAVDVLRGLPEDKSIAALRNLRVVDPGDTAALLASVSEHTAPTHVTTRPPAQDSREFELMLRHNIAYPTLMPLDGARASTTSYLVEARFNPTTGEASTFSSETPETPPPPGYCDDRLGLLEIANWTGAPISNALAASLISLYLQVDHPTLGLFDDDLFLESLINQGPFCSRLLVSAILEWACHAYSSVLPVLDLVSEVLHLETKTMWPYDQAFDSLPTVAAAQLLHLSATYNGEEEAHMYMSVGSAMAQRMGLFGVGRQKHTGDPTWQRALAHTAWGVYNCIAMDSFIFQTCDAALEYPPVLDIPGGYGDRRLDEAITDGAPSRDLPAYMGRTFPAMCGFWVITSEWMLRHYGGDVSWEFTQRAFKKLLAWTDGLHVTLARGDQITHHGYILHIWLHASISQLFRPFARTPGDLEEEAASVFDASLHQLKHMLLVFQETYQCASYAIFWHFALLHVANASLEDSKDTQWRAYFNMCVTLYGDLFGDFRVAEGIVKSLLSIALRKGLMDGAEARSILERVTARKKGGNRPRSSAFIVDLNLAVTDRGGAQLEALDNSFDAMRLFNEFVDADGAQDSPSVDEEEVN